ncbi:MAG: glycoside hydrolase family 127 protein [Bacteroidales bacterium]|nr:glycoside hydrolase family 127 protein [Bacteroidales bacterium]
MNDNLKTLLILPILFISSCSPKQERPKDYPILPVPFTQVTVTDNFWAPRIRTNSEVTIPIAFRHCETTGRVKNFEIAGGTAVGSFCTEYPFDDSDVYKIIEGASYALHVDYDPELDRYMDTLIMKIAAAQEEDGYLYTNRTIDPDSAHPWAGTKRWELEHELSHELYNVGHLYEAAVANYMATGKRSLLDVALKNAELIAHDFGWGKVEEYTGHQEIEIGLVKLYRVTGDRRYLDLAKFFLDVRGPGGEEYCQAHQKVVDQTEAVGHAVRACYMYSAMADVAALTGDQAYVDAISRIWENVVSKKYYITGGIGQAGYNEGFGEDYYLPNLEAYCETCASIAMVFWNHRLFLMKGDARYLDVLERTLYNAAVDGVALSGDLFFYPNPLASDGRHHRRPWFGCACCPSNICRFLPSMPGYIYSYRENEIFVNLYVTSEASIETGKKQISIKQESQYPWDGDISITVDPQRSTRFTLSLRIPGWARNEPVPGDLYRFEDQDDQKVMVMVNGKIANASQQDGLIKIDRKWKKGDKVELILPMPVRKIVAHEKVEANRGFIVLQRGPLVYCLEGKDQPEGKVSACYLLDTSKITPRYREDLLGGIMVLEMNGKSLSVHNNNQITTNNNQSREARSAEQITTTYPLTAVPYCYWANRGPGEMAVWLKVNMNILK